MSNLDELLTNNARFAAGDAKDQVPAIPFLPNKQVYLITCIDPRVDPVDLLGLKLGDAIVARNVGGRVTDAVLSDLAWISYLHEHKTPDAPWFELAIIHHTDCGSALMADDQLRAGFVDRDSMTLNCSAPPLLSPPVRWRTTSAGSSNHLSYQHKSRHRDTPTTFTPGCSPRWCPQSGSGPDHDWRAEVRCGRLR